MNLANLARQARSLGLAAEPERPSHADARFNGPGGYQYGAMYPDGSVYAPWNGANQHRQALRHVQKARARWPQQADIHHVVRRQRDGWPWNLLTDEEVKALPVKP